MRPKETQELFEQIEAYLAGKLMGADLTAFEKRLADDAVFKQKVALHAELAALHDPALDAFKATLEQTNKEVKLDQKAPVSAEQSLDKASKGGVVVALDSWRSARSVRRMLAVAASLFAVLLAGYFLFQYNASSFSNMIRAEIRQLETPSPSRSNLSSAQTLAQSGYEAYRKKDYANAYTLLSTAAETEQNDMDIAFFTGLSAYRDQQPTSEPLVALLHVVSQGKSVWIDEATWLSALIYLERDQFDTAKTLLIDLADNGDQVYRQKATKLLSKLP